MPTINLKKADKGTTTVVLVMNTQDEIKEGQIHLDKEEHYKNLPSPMVVDTHRKVEQLINDLTIMATT